MSCASALAQRHWLSESGSSTWLRCSTHFLWFRCWIRSLDPGILERYVEMADCDELSYATFYDWFEPAFVALLREILDDAIENLETGRADLNGRLERFQDVLIADRDHRLAVPGRC